MTFIVVSPQEKDLRSLRRGPDRNFLQGREGPADRVVAFDGHDEQQKASAARPAQLAPVGAGVPVGIGAASDGLGEPVRGTENASPSPLSVG